MKDDEVKSRAAKARWKILAQALKKNKKQDSFDTSQFSVRNFGGFDLFDVKPIVKKEQLLKERWLDYRLKTEEGSHSIAVRLLKDNFSAEELFGFNNTGNVCIWPSEEVLGYYCCKHKDLFKNKRVIELGCGMTALAGLQVAIHTEVSEILLTDGNEKGIQNVSVMLEENKETLKQKNTHCRVLKWKDSYDEADWTRQGYDVIISADCLFFVALHETLIYTLDYLMTDKGQCIFVAPSRSGTLEQFVELARDMFNITVEKAYDDLLYERHLHHLKNTPSYNEDLHFPILVVLTKK